MYQLGEQFGGAFLSRYRYTSEFPQVSRLDCVRSGRGRIGKPQRPIERTEPPKQESKFLPALRNLPLLHCVSMPE
jgi:hypothetical protein